MLHKCDIPSQVGAEILDDIFGKRFGSTYIEGLVDASDYIDLQEKVEKAVERWKRISLPSCAKIEKFIYWFQEYHLVYNTTVSFWKHLLSL